MMETVCTLQNQRPMLILGKVYQSILLRESYREGTKVKNRTLANLSGCSKSDIEAIRLGLKNA